MEGPRDNKTPRISKLKPLNCNVSSINAQKENQQLFIDRGQYLHPSKSPSFDPYAAADKSNFENLESTLIRYLQSRSPAPAAVGNALKAQAVDSPKHLLMIGHQYLNSNSSGGSSGFGLRGSSSVSPLSSIENLVTPPSRSPAVFRAPIEVEEDIVVIDGILVGSALGGRLRSSKSSNSGGSSSSGSNSFYKTEICRSWEDSPQSHCGFKCQLAHGKEEVRPSRFYNKNKSQAQTCKSYSSSESCSYDGKCRVFHHQVSKSESPTEVKATALPKVPNTSSIEPENSSDSSSSSVKFTSADCSPLDDYIEVVLPPSASTEKNTSREAFNAYMQGVLYGLSQGKRLPVFAGICPE